MLRWKRENGERAEKLWDDLAATNTEIFNCVEDLNRQHSVSVGLLVCTFEESWAGLFS